MKKSHDLIYFGNETLKQLAEPVESFNPELKDFIKEMEYIMHEADGIGLAAPQVDVTKRIITIDLSSSNKGEKLSIVNPEITWSSDDRVPFDEGCLSVPGIYEQVLRPSKITVSAYNMNGEKVEIKADGLLARVLQHEIDHLNGLLFIDRLDEFIRKEYTKELKKIKKMNRK